MPAPPKKPRAVAPKAAPSSKKKETRKVKKFAIEPWDGSGEGERVVIYSSSGMGKTTLASLAPEPVFVGVDPGGRKIRRGDQPLLHLPVTNYLELRDCLAQPGLFKQGQSLVIDTMTRVESEWIIPEILATVTNDKGGKVKYIERYGYGKGWQFVLDHTRLLLSDLDRVAAQGVNIILLCQEAAITIANAEGTDFLQNGPKLTHTRQSSCRQEVSEWADHVFRIGYHETDVTAGAEDRVGKIDGDDTTRVIYTQEARHFTAKSRPIVGRETLEPVISFESVVDDSLWQMMFG
jgi:hypothetical protein